MNANEVVKIAEAKLGKHFPELVVRLFPDPDDDATFFAYIFCVPDGTESDVRACAREFIHTSLTEVGEWDIISSIKNLSVTQEHYPQYLRQPATSNDIEPNSKVVPSLRSNFSSKQSPVTLVDFVRDEQVKYDCPNIKPISQKKQ